MPEVLKNLLGITLKIDSPIPAWKLLITKLHAVVRRTCSVIDCCASLAHIFHARMSCVDSANAGLHYEFKDKDSMILIDLSAPRRVLHILWKTQNHRQKPSISPKTPLNGQQPKT